MNPLQRSPKYMLLFYYLLLVSIATLLLNVLNLVVIVSTLLLMFKLFFKTPGASNPSSRTSPTQPITIIQSHLQSQLLGLQRFLHWETKRRLNDRKTEHFKAILKHDHSSVIADHVKTTGHNIKWDYFDILASGKTDYHCKVKETLFIQELQPAMNANVSSEQLLLYQGAFSLSLNRQFPFETS